MSYHEYLFESLDYEPRTSMLYTDVSDEFKLSSADVDTSRLGVRTLAVWDTLVENFELFYATREIGYDTEIGFFSAMQSCLNRNADTFERQLEVYDDDIAKPILGRTEKVTYDTIDKRDGTFDSDITYGRVTTDTESGNNIEHHVEVPADNPDDDTDRTRDRTEFGHSNTESNEGTDKAKQKNDETRKMTGTVTTELSDIGVRPNYETMNGFLRENKTYIQFFIEVFEECFAPRYKRVYFRWMNRK